MGSIIIYGSKNYYESKFKENFKLVVITNSDFSPAAMTLSNANNVFLVNRKNMNELIESVEISIQDIYKIETQRMKNI